MRVLGFVVALPFRPAFPRTLLGRAPLLVATFALFGAAAAGAQAQQGIPGVTLPGVPNNAAGAEGQSFGATESVAAGNVRANNFSSTVDAGGLLGLKEPAGGAARQVLMLGDVLALLDRDAADLKIAAERVVQQEANLRRAWAAVLPTLSLSGNYALTCLGGGETGLPSCEDRTTEIVNPEQLEQQAQLFDGIASALEIGANVSNDPEEQAQLLDQAGNLRLAADETRQSASTAKPVVVQPASQFSGALTMQLPLFNARAFPLLFNAMDNVDVAGDARTQTKNTLQYAATRAYYAAVTAQKLVTIAERQLEIATKHKEATKARVESSTQPQLALRRAELEVLRTKQQLRSSRAAYDAAIASIGVLLAREETFDVVAPPIETARPSAFNADALIEKAIATRPDVSAERRALEIVKRSELDAWLMFAPSVNLIASARATSFTQGFVTDPITGTLSITASLPLYDGGLRYAALKDSSSRIREESIRMRQLEDRVRAQVRGNIRDIEVRSDSLAITQEAVAVARVAHEQAQAMFDAGVGTSLDVSDTALALFVTENDLARAELELQLALAGLSFVTGYPK